MGQPHIGIDSPEHEALVHKVLEESFSKDRVGKQRAAELDVLTSKR
jgi:hypothetical protein